MTTSSRFLCVFVMFAFALLNVSAEVNVDASLSSSQAAVGEAVELQISVQGAQSARFPQDINVPGLDIKYRGQSTQFQMTNFKVTTSVIHSFVVLPRQEGNFEIPALTIEVGRNSYKTRAISLRVSGVARTPLPGRPQAAPRGFPGVPGGRNVPPVPQSVSVEDIARAELIVPQDSVYVGQMLPVELRLYFDRRFRFQIDQAPVFSGEGFTAEKLSEPEEREQTIDGVPFSVLTFKTAITPVKIGEMEVSPAELQCGVVVPGQRGAIDDFFGDFFGGNSPFGNELRELQIRSNAVSLEVKALPKEGRPADFSGAIGSFTLSGGVSPQQAKVGEPLTLSYTVEGYGNFSNIGAPKLMDAENWKVYPGKSEFTSKDVIGFHGEKHFDMTLVSRTDQTATPKARFNFFDPSTEKYETVEAEPFPVVITGGAANSPASVVADTTDLSDKKESSEAAADSPDSELTAVPMSKFTPGSFRSVFKSKAFLLVNAVAGVAYLILLGFAGVGVWRRSDAGARSRERKARGRVIRRMQASSIEQKDFYQMAYELFQTIEKTSSSDLEEARALAQMRRDENVFGKVSHIPKSVFDEEKATILSALKKERVL